MLESFKFRSDDAPHYEILSFVIGGLLFQQGRKGQDPYGGINIEDVFNAVQLLAERNDLEVAPFVSSWHAEVEKFDRVKVRQPRLDMGRIADAFEASFGSRSYGINSLSRILEGFAQKILDAVKEQQGIPSEGRIFRETNDLMIRKLRTFVWLTESERVRYLKPLLNLYNQQQRLVIVTLNYDNSVELLSETEGVTCNTGIENFADDKPFDISAQGLYLLKLHGSIDWSQSYSKPQYYVADPITKKSVKVPDEEVGMPKYVLTKVHANVVSSGRYKPALIFGQRNKLTTEGPFLDLLRLFREELATVNKVTIVGYSFRDTHVNEYLWQWLTRGGDKRVRIIDPGFAKHPRLPPWSRTPRYGQAVGEEYVEQLRTWCKERLEILPEGAASGLEKTFG